VESKLWVIVPAAGESRRFKEAGYFTPKPLLKIRDNGGLSLRMVTHVIANLPPVTCRDVIVGLPAGVEPVVPFYKYLSIINTEGQADTVFQMIQKLPFDDSVLVLDCDMMLEPNDIQKLIDLLQIYDVTVAVAETFDPNSSRVDSVPFPTRFVEKEPISQYGIVGARGFKKIRNLTQAIVRANIDIHTELYLSHAMNYCMGTKYAHIVTEFTDLGTPERIREIGWEIVS